MMDLEPQNQILVLENNIVSCETAGIYVQGKASKPTFKGYVHNSQKVNAL